VVPAEGLRDLAAKRPDLLLEVRGRFFHEFL
jgi:hypothetical protein